MTLELGISEELAARAAEAARRRGVSVEELLLASLEEALARESEFESVVGAVLAENAELYRRLA